MKPFGFLVALLMSVTASASPAGVIPYACVSDDPYVLLAFDPAPLRLGYGAFGGSREGSESIAETAAREFYEETRCAFDTPSAQQLATMTPSKNGVYYAYVAEVPFMSHLDIPKHPCDARIERSDWQWVRLSDLDQALQQESARPKVLVSLMHKYITLWDKGAASLRAAKRDGLLDTDKLCK